MISSENKMNPLIKFLFLIVLLSGLAVSCVDVPEPEPDPEPEKEKAPALTIKINELIEAVMTDVYFRYK